MKQILLLCFKVLLFAMPLFLCAGEAWSNANPARYSTFSTDHAIWFETFASDQVPFTVEYLDGAEGTVEMIDSGGRSEKKALRIVKTNNEGFIVVRFHQKISIRKGDRIQFNVFYRGIDGSTPYSVAYLRLWSPGEKSFAYQSFFPGIDGSRRMHKILLTAPETWEHKFTQRKIAEGIELLEPILAIGGAASTSIWDDFYIEFEADAKRNWQTIQRPYTPVDRMSQMISNDELDNIIASEKDHTGKIVTIDGRSRMLIDGEVVFPLINSPFDHFIRGANYSNMRDFLAAGVTLSKIGIRLGQGRPFSITGYRGCWTGKDQIDLSGAIEHFRNALRLAPQAKFILEISLFAYADFCKDYPSETWIGKNGNPVLGNGIHIAESLDAVQTENRYPWPSYHSKILQNEYKKQIACIISELRKAGLLKFVVGIMICGGHDVQMASPHLDYSEPAQAAFRDFLRREYGTVEALRRAWQDEQVTFETVQMPIIDSVADCFDPETEQREIDLFRFNKLSGWRVADEIAEYARTLVGKDVFTVRYCMSPFSGTPGSSMDIGDFLHNQNFDCLAAQANYGSRPPAMACTSFLPLASFHKNGKLFINEFDIRTWNAAAGYEKEIMSYTWGIMLDYPMWLAGHRKLTGSMLAHDMGMWYLDMAPGRYDNEQIISDIKDVHITAQQLIQRPVSSWHPDAAFVIDEQGLFLRNLLASPYMFDVTGITQYQLYLLGYSSVPFAFYTLDDFLEDPELAKSFKVIVFAAMYNIDEKRSILLRNLQSDNRTLIFLSGTGRLGGVETTGFQLTDNIRRQRNHHVIAEPGVTDIMSSYWMIRGERHPEAKSFWYESIPLISAVARPGDKVLARFAVNQAPAVLEHQYTNWKAVYIGESGGLSPEYFNTLATAAGAYCLTESGFQCETNGNFMMVHCMKNGKKTFKMPFKANVRNLVNGKFYYGVTEITVEAEAGSTYWFELTPVE